MRLRSARPWAAVVAALALVHGGCVCLDLAQPRRYRCAQDGQCMGGWRCGTDGFCVDPSGDSLRANSGAPPVTVSKVSPADPQGLPDLIATTQDGISFPGSCADAGGRSQWTAEPVIAQVRGDQVSLTANWPDSRESLPDGGLPRGSSCTLTAAPPLYQDRFTGSLGGRRAVDLAVVGGIPHVLVEGGGLCSFQWAPGTATMTPTCRSAAFPFAATRLRSGPGHQDLLLAYSPSRYGVYNLVTNSVSSAQVVTALGQPQTISDMILHGRRGAELLTAVSDAGLFVSSLAGYRFENDGGAPPPFGFWEPVQTQEIPCERNSSGSSTGAPLDLRLLYDYQNTVSSDPMLVVHVQRRDFFGRAEDHTLLYRATRDAGSFGSGGCVPLPTGQWSPSNRYYYGESFRDCAPCEDDHSLRDYRLGWQYPDFGTGAGDPTLVMEARCVPRDGGTSEQVNVLHDVMDSCSGKSNLTLPDIARYARPTRWDRSDGYAGAYANDLGHLYASDYVSGLALPSVVMDRAPSAIIQTVSGLAASTSSESIGNRFDDLRIGLLPRELFREGGPGFGGLGNDFFPPHAAVAGRPTWALVGDESVGLYIVVENTTRPLTQEQIPLRILAHFADTVAPVPPFVGAALRNAAGRQILIVSFSDALTAVDVTELADDPNAGGFDEQAFYASPALEVRVVPLPRTPITAIVPLPPDPDAGTPLFAEAFVAQGGRVFHVTAANHTLWRAEEIDLGGAEVLTVTADGRRGRAGTRDGRLFAVPSRVPLAGPLPGAPVMDYAQAGATTFAVAQGGLYRLVSDGVSPQGTWEQIPVSPLPADGRGFTGARMYSLADQLLLFLHSGWGYKINGGR